MKAFLERNKPLFVFGLITLLLFIALIVIYEFKSHETPKMQKIGNESGYVIDENNQEAIPTETPQSTASDIDIDKTYGVVTIEFKNGNWNKSFYTAIRGQSVVWKNLSDKSIYLRQRSGTYDELKNPTEIKPGESFTFKMMKNGDFSFDEQGTFSFAIIRVSNLEE